MSSVVLLVLGGQQPAERCFSAGYPPALVTSAERDSLDGGELLLRIIPIEGRSWPRVCTYSVIDADPQTSIAVLMDYHLQVSYMPRVLHAEVVPDTDATATHVAYVVDVPLWRDEVDTLRETIRRVTGRSGDGYALEWHALASTGTNAIDGSATFVPWRNAQTARVGTLMVYEQAVDPKSWLTRIPFIRNRGIDAVRDATTALARRIATELQSEPDLLAGQMATFKRTLAP
ncbi:MAG: hypothetical protein JWM95_1173 [Gemmatimonadetes bacterium]|nr:hypothetical protein [Gemmatimonadota bacterium]